MEFTSVVDGKEFVATKKNVDEYIEDVNFSIKHGSDYSANNFQIICDSDEMIHYVMEKIIESNPEYKTYDLSQNKTNNLLELSEIIKERPVIVYGIEEYLKYVNETFYNGALCTICGKQYMESQNRFYTAIELARDSLFSKYKTKVVFIMSNSEYNVFLNLADDFASYYPECFEFNKTMYNKNGDKESLFDYLVYVKRGLKPVNKSLVDDKK